MDDNDTSADELPSDPTDREQSSGGRPRRPKLPPRVARERLADALDYQALLTLTRRARLRLGSDDAALDPFLAEARRSVDRYTALAEGRVEGRRRPPVQQEWRETDPPRRQYILCLDECGSHQINPRGDRFPAFGLCGVIIDEEQYVAFDRAWKRWKATWLRDPRYVVHEPELRGREGRYHRADPDEQRQLLEALDVLLHKLEFHVIAAVIHKPEFVATFGEDPVDAFLPRSQYLICLDFVVERFVHFLYYHGADARGLVVAESRGPLEDSQVQQEYIRLQLEGTQFQSASWFRYQLARFIEFIPKRLNYSGLQLADLAARPCAEKVLRPTSDPERWSVFREKLYDGGSGRPESYGLKSFPTAVARSIFADMTDLKANGDAVAPPPAD